MSCDNPQASMDRWSAARRLIDDQVDAAVRAACGKDSVVIYSAYKSGPDPDNLPIDNLKKVAVKGKVRLIGYADDFFGGSKSKEYRSEILENPTWLQVCVCADAMIRATNDHHHAFLEGLDKLPKAKQTEPGVTLYEFCMGS
jgi:hypothetical protein